MNIEKERERFEAYYARNYGYQEGHVFFREDTGYINRDIQREWNGWYAAKQDEMTEEKAREIYLKLEKEKHARLFNADGQIISSMEGIFDVNQLKALVWLMENKA